MHSLLEAPLPRAVALHVGVEAVAAAQHLDAAPSPHEAQQAAGLVHVLLNLFVIQPAGQGWGCLLGSGVAGSCTLEPQQASSHKAAGLKRTTLKQAPCRLTATKPASTLSSAWPWRCTSTSVCRATVCVSSATCDV